MTRRERKLEELKQRLTELADVYNSTDPERGHRLADYALLDYIDNADVTAKFIKMTRLYV